MSYSLHTSDLDISIPAATLFIDAFLLTYTENSKWWTKWPMGNDKLSILMTVCLCFNWEQNINTLKSINAATKISDLKLW